MGVGGSVGLGVDRCVCDGVESDDGMEFVIGYVCDMGSSGVLLMK